LFSLAKQFFKFKYNKTLLNVNKNKDYKTKDIVYLKESKSYIKKMLKGHVIKENLILDFINNLVYLNNNTIK